MSLAHVIINSSPHCACVSNGLITRRVADVAAPKRGLGNFAIELRKLGSNCRDFYGSAVSNVNVVANTVERGEIVASDPQIEIPVTCFKILGVSEKAEKDEIVKAAMELRNSEIEEGYSAEVPASRQGLLMDVRDKLLFEAEYAGNKKENILPKNLCIPWTWLPASLCLLQEVGEAKLVLEIGRAAMQRNDSKPYTHDILLSMALAECSIAKIGFEKNKVPEGFEALARAQYLLRSKISSAKLPLLNQIEQSLEELAPACTLSLLALPASPKRKGALSALTELLAQALDLNSSSSASSSQSAVRDWPSFLCEALGLLSAREVAGLVPWESFAETRRNRKSVLSQAQRRVLDFECFFVGVVAHLALGFSAREIEMIRKAKTICECLVASDGVDLKLVESFCSFLLGQESASVVFEKLKQVESNGNSNPKSFDSAAFKGEKGKDNINRSLEMWLKDSVLSLFPDTRDCSPSLASFFEGSKRGLYSSSHKQKLSSSSFPFNPLHENKTISKASLNSSCITHLGEAVRQLAPANQSDFATSASVSTAPTFAPLKRNPQKGNWSPFDLAQKLAFSTVLGCALFGTFKLANWQFGHQIKNLNSNSNSGSTMCVNSPSFIKGSVWNRLGKVSTLLSLNRKRFSNSENEERIRNLNLSIYRKREMDLEEAEEIVKQWQEIKSDALGPTHQIGELSLLLDESMLSKWQELAKSAKEQCCFWRFVLLKMSVIRAEIISDEIGSESAEIEALLEEAAELVDESQPKKPSYYSTYKVQYRLKRQDDRSWRICSGDVQNLE